MKVENARIPFDTHFANDVFHRGLGLCHENLVTNVQYSTGRKHVAIMLHYFQVVAVLAHNLVQIESPA